MGDLGKTIAEKKDRFDAWLKAQSDAVRATRATRAGRCAVIVRRSSPRRVDGDGRGGRAFAVMGWRMKD